MQIDNSRIASRGNAAGALPEEAAPAASNAKARALQGGNNARALELDQPQLPATAVRKSLLGHPPANPGLMGASMNSALAELERSVSVFNVAELLMMINKELNTMASTDRQMALDGHTRAIEASVKQLKDSAEKKWQAALTTNIASIAGSAISLGASCHAMRGAGGGSGPKTQAAPKVDVKPDIKLDVKPDIKLAANPAGGKPAGRASSALASPDVHAAPAPAASVGRQSVDLSRQSFSSLGSLDNPPRQSIASSTGSVSANRQANRNSAPLPSRAEPLVPAPAAPVGRKSVELHSSPSLTGGSDSHPRLSVASSSDLGSTSVSASASSTAPAPASMAVPAAGQQVADKSMKAAEMQAIMGIGGAMSNSVATGGKIAGDAMNKDAELMAAESRKWDAIGSRMEKAFAMANESRDAVRESVGAVKDLLRAKAQSEAEAAKSIARNL